MGQDWCLYADARFGAGSRIGKIMMALDHKHWMGQGAYGSYWTGIVAYLRRSRLPSPRAFMMKFESFFASLYSALDFRRTYSP